MRSHAFIPPAAPHRRERPPRTPGWIHEVKFDGFRAQFHKITRHYPMIATAAKALPGREAIIDAELVACGNSGLPNFYRLLDGKADPYELYLWAFDLLHLNGRDLRHRPLMERKGRLQALLDRAPSPAILPSKGFTDPLRLLAEGEKRKLEGTVSKRIDASYRYGDRTDGIKVKSQSWREANKDRWRLFEGSRRAARSSNGR
jgi:bifunctional non-homologous end joining protein LigD